MGHTIVEKILAAHAAIADCKPGDFLVADIDFAMLTDARAPGANRPYLGSLLAASA
jgi:3-isopropylmalate/(R)-2-methylmalate dehydratase large subunit